MLSPPYFSHLRHCNVSYEKSKQSVQPQRTRMSRIDSCHIVRVVGFVGQARRLPNDCSPEITQTIAAVARVAQVAAGNNSASQPVAEQWPRIAATIQISYLR